MFISDDNFMRIVETGNGMSNQPKLFKVFNPATSASMKANIGGILNALKYPALSNNVASDWRHYLLLVKQAQMYNWSTMIDVLSFMQLMTSSDSPFKRQSMIEIMVDCIKSGFCKEDIGFFSPAQLNLLFEEDIVTKQEGSEPLVIWISGIPVWRGAKFNAEAYRKLNKTAALNHGLFDAVVIP